MLWCVQVNLMQYMKLSTSRDFRINTATLEAALQEQQQNESQQVCLHVFYILRLIIISQLHENLVKLILQSNHKK